MGGESISYFVEDKGISGDLNYRWLSFSTSPRRHNHPPPPPTHPIPKVGTSAKLVAARLAPTEQSIRIPHLSLRLPDLPALIKTWRTSFRATHHPKKQRTPTPQQYLTHNPNADDWIPYFPDSSQTHSNWGNYNKNRRPVDISAQSFLPYQIRFAQIPSFRAYPPSSTLLSPTPPE